MARVTEEAWYRMHTKAPPLIVWEQRGHSFGALGYTYGAVFIQDRQTWYLAGDAEYYGSREINDHTMRRIIEDDDTGSWWFNSDWVKGHTFATT